MIRKIATGVQKSLYPLDYNYNDPMSNYDEWIKYIQNQTLIYSYSPQFVFQIEQRNFNANLEEKKMDQLVLVANQILNK